MSRGMLLPGIKDAQGILHTLSTSNRGQADVHVSLAVQDLGEPFAPWCDSPASSGSLNFAKCPEGFG